MYGCNTGEKDALKILLMVTAMLIATVIILSFAPRVLGNGESNNGNYTENEYDDNLTIPTDDFTISLDNETLPSCLGKNMSLLIRNITQTHRENLLRIRLQRRIMLENTWYERLRLLNQTRSETRLCIEERKREMERLREMLRQGNITREEFIMEMNRIRLEIRTRLSLSKETSKEALKALQANISEENKRFARQIVEENHRFQQEMRQLHERIKEEVRERVREQVQNKGQGRGKGKK
ncbi:MAG: hypothetical protein FGF52_01800 [Candidatus Brockarchaeota archaeon]|nr:hypothetical protein [Candidatus Brockarchaeota archaeon]